MKKQYTFLVLGLCAGLLQLHAVTMTIQMTLHVRQEEIRFSLIVSHSWMKTIR